MVFWYKKMNVIGVQLVLLFFAFIMGYYLFLNWKKGDISGKSFSSWVFIWLVFGILAIFPKLLEPLIEELFIVRVMDLGVIVALMIITFLTLENNIKIMKLERNTEKLVRKLAVKSVKRKKDISNGS